MAAAALGPGSVTPIHHSAWLPGIFREVKERPMDKTLAVALGGLLAAGAAVGAYKTGVIGAQYADVVRTTPVTIKEPVYADVVDAVPITQTSESPQRVCGNQTVQVRQPERFGNRDGAALGAVVGGLLGHQVGGGSGRTAATIGGAV